MRQEALEIATRTTHIINSELPALPSAPSRVYTVGRAAMAYSSSEVLHGPAGMMNANYPVLALALGPEKHDVLECVEKLDAMGADCHVLTTPLRQDKLSATLILCQVYLEIEQACVLRGLSPDTPRNLSKVTLT